MRVRSAAAAEEKEEEEEEEKVGSYVATRKPFYVIVVLHLWLLTLTAIENTFLFNLAIKTIRENPEYRTLNK